MYITDMCPYMLWKSLWETVLTQCSSFQTSYMSFLKLCHEMKATITVVREDLHLCALMRHNDIHSLHVTDNGKNYLYINVSTPFTLHARFPQRVPFLTRFRNSQPQNTENIIRELHWKADQRNLTVQLTLITASSILQTLQRCTCNS